MTDMGHLERMIESTAILKWGRMSIFRRTALLVASAISAGTIGLGVLPASAATVPAVRAGSILCSGDLCLQTVSVNTTNHTVQVNAWADTKTINPGYFVLTTPPNSSGVSEVGFSPVGDWPAGGKHYTFTVQLEHGTYDMTAYSGGTLGKGAVVGDKTFGVNF